MKKQMDDLYDEKYDDEMLEEEMDADVDDLENITAQPIPVDVEKKDVYEIMDTYNQGKVLAQSVEETLRVLLKLKKKDKLVTSSLLSKAPDGISESDFKELVDTFMKGNALMTKAKEEMINKLDMFIYYIIEKQFNTFKKYTKDLYQEGIVGILKGIDTYNPQKSKPTTFFYIYIIHEMTEFINMNINKTTSHYSANIVRVKKAINHFEREGREWTIKDIAQETRISAETIAQALNIMESANEVHYDTVDYLDSQMSQRCPSPEEEYLKNERSQIIQMAVDMLPEDEANVIKLRYGLSGEEAMAYKTIATRLNIQIDKVKKLHNSGIRRLRNNRVINGNFKNLKKEEQALNSSMIGIIPVGTAEKIMDDLDAIFEEEEKRA